VSELFAGRRAGRAAVAVVMGNTSTEPWTIAWANSNRLQTPELAM
jgi:hypothetical protein